MKENRCFMNWQNKLRLTGVLSVIIMMVLVATLTGTQEAKAESLYIGMDIDRDDLSSVKEIEINDLMNDRKQTALKYFVVDGIAAVTGWRWEISIDVDYDENIQRLLSQDGKDEIDISLFYENIDEIRFVKVVGNRVSYPNQYESQITREQLNSMEFSKGNLEERYITGSRIATLNLDVEGLRSTPAIFYADAKYIDFLTSPLSPFSL